MAKPLLVFSDDWGRHPSSCQHLIHHLLGDYSVTWVNTIGMRPPRFDLLTVKRSLEKLNGWIKPKDESSYSAQQMPEGLKVIDAKMWPWMKHSWDRKINRHLLTKQLHDAARNSVAITTIPIVSDLVGKIPAIKWIYYCVDDFSVWPGLDGKSLLQQENKLIQDVDQIICVSETLRDSVRSRGRESSLLTHGVDVDFWQKPTATVDRQEFHLPSARPFALFWGVIDRRMNADWLIELANQLTDEFIVLAGPTQDPDSRILDHQRIHMLGPVAFHSLPKLATLANVLIMPYADLPVTRAMQPLKLKEYLATYKPVVASRLPAVELLEHCLEMTETKELFIEKTIFWMRSKTQSGNGGDESVRRLHLVRNADRIT